MIVQVTGLRLHSADWWSFLYLRMLGIAEVLVQCFGVDVLSTGCTLCTFSYLYLSPYN